MEPMTDDPVKDEKYIVFKRTEFYEWWSLPTVGGVAHEVGMPNPVHDAVVIRRQDYFAAPALNAYASCIAIAARLMQHDQVRQQELISIADYFHQQAEAAGDEAWKLPD